MSSAKNAAINDSIEPPIHVLKDGKCPTSSGKSTLGYQAGTDASAKTTKSPRKSPAASRKGK